MASRSSSGAAPTSTPRARRSLTRSTPLRIFDRLASAQLELRTLVDARLAALERERPAFSEIPADTQARTLVDVRLEAKTDLAAIERHATLER